MQCPKCKHEIHLKMALEDMIFCPYCDQRMVEPKEDVLAVVDKEVEAPVSEVSPAPVPVPAAAEPPQEKAENHPTAPVQTPRAGKKKQSLPVAPQSRELAEPEPAKKALEVPQTPAKEAFTSSELALNVEKIVRQEVVVPPASVEEPPAPPIAETPLLPFENAPAPAESVQKMEDATPEYVSPRIEAFETAVSLDLQHPAAPADEAVPEILVEAENEECVIEIILPSAATPVAVQKEKVEETVIVSETPPSPVEEPAAKVESVEKIPTAGVVEAPKESPITDPSSVAEPELSPSVPVAEAVLQVPMHEVNVPEVSHTPPGEKVYCTACGQLLGADFGFCYRCGKKVVTSTEQAQRSEKKPQPLVTESIAVELRATPELHQEKVEARLIESKAAEAPAKPKARTVPAYYKRPQSFAPARENMSEAMRDRAPSLPHFPKRKKESVDYVSKIKQAVEKGWGATLTWVKGITGTVQARIGGQQKAAAPIPTTGKKAAARTRAEVQTAWLYVIIAALVFIAVFVAIGLLLGRG